MDIILDEKEMALKSINTGYIDYKKPSSTIRTIIKYYYTIGMDRAQIRDEIESFMVKNYMDYNPATWQPMLDKMVKTYSKEKYVLIKIKSISITKSEFEKIRSLKNIKLEKIAFVLLVYAKVLNKINPTNDNWVNKEINMLIKTAKITETGDQQRLLLKQLSDSEYIQIPKTVDKASMRVNFVDNNMESDVVLEVLDFENIIMGYLMLIGEKIIKCDGCGKFIKQTTINKKYCNVCREKIDKELNKERCNKYYQKKVSHGIR